MGFGACPEVRKMIDLNCRIFSRLIELCVAPSLFKFRSYLTYLLKTGLLCYEKYLSCYARSY